MPAVVEAIVKSGVFIAVLALFDIERIEYGVDVPTPNLIFVLSQAKSVLFESVSAADQKAILPAAPPDKDADPFERQVPLGIMKQPLVSCIPFAKVEEAEPV